MTRSSGSRSKDWDNRQGTRSPAAIAAIDFPISLKLDPRRDLSRAPAAELHAARARDRAKAVVGNVELRIAQIHAVGDIGERGLHFQPDSLSQRESFARACIPTERAGTLDDSHTRV